MDTFTTKFIVGVLAASTVSGGALADSNIWHQRAKEYGLPRHEMLRICDNDAAYVRLAIKDRLENVPWREARQFVAGDPTGVYIVDVVYTTPEPEPGVSWDRVTNLLETRIFNECAESAPPK